MRTNTVLIRLVFIGILIGAGYLLDPIGHALPGRTHLYGIPTNCVSALLALVIAFVIILFEMRIQQASLKTLIGAGIGSMMGIVGGVLIGFLISYKAPRRDVKILDTSVIIDGRIADVAETGFLSGTIVVPQFILRELQQVADSPDSSKRQRGRRGLDMLNRLQSNPSLDIQVVDTDFPAVKEVDLKLLELSKSLDGVVVTNDFNLNKVAQLHGLQVLNINELANSLKAVVLPGEAMRVFILKEGKEYNQGVAYLDDGTMVVVDNARRMIGKNADIAVTSVLQKTAGKMIFGRLWEEAENGHNDIHRTNGSSRRQVRDSRSGPHPVRITDSEPLTEG